MGSWLTGKKSSADTQPTLALRFQTSVQGKPLPILYGQTRVSANVIWYGDFFSQSSGGSAGGKGGGSSGGGLGKGKNTGNSYDYFVSVAFGLCEGPIDSVLNVWNNKAVETAAEWGFTIFDGDYAQIAWGYLTTNHPTEAFNYRGVAYAAQASMALGSNDSLPNLSWEVKAGISDALAGEPDANPRDVIVDLLTNAFYGVGFPPENLDSQMVAASAYWLATGLVISPALTDQKELSSTLNEMLPALNVGARWSGGVLTFVPWGDTAVSAGAVTLIVENDAVPAAWPYVKTVAQLGKFVSDQGVTYHGAGALTRVSGTPQIGQYAVDTIGNYTFAAADAGASVDISYDFAAVASYVPDVQPLYDITSDDLLPNEGSAGASGIPSQSPIILVRKPKTQMVNDVQVEFLDRSNAYDPATVDAKDQAGIDTFGLRSSGTRSAHFFCLSDAAALSSHLQLVREQIAATFVFTLPSSFILPDVEDILTLTYEPQGLVRKPVRITEIQENQSGTLTFTAEEYLGTAGKPLYGSQAGSGATINTNVDPGMVNEPIIFEPTFALAGDQEVWIGVSGVMTDVWGGCDVWLSLDGTNYQKQTGTILGAARMGVLTADLPAVPPADSGQTIDTTHTLSVDLTESAGVMTSGSQADAQAYNTLCWVGGELIAYETATLTSANNYDLTYLVRGSLGSAISDHPVGTQFLRLDNAIFKIPYTDDRVGQTLHVKFVSYNAWGGGQQSLADVPDYTYTVGGSGPPPDVTGFTGAPIGDLTTLSWDPVTVYNLAYYEVRFTTDTDSPAWSASVLVQSGITSTSIQVNTQPGAYLIKAVNTVGQYSPDPAIVEMFVDPATQRNVVLTVDEQPSFAGVKTNCFAVDGALRLSGAGEMSAWTTLSVVVPSIGYYLGIVTAGEYDFANSVDLGAVFPCRVTLNMTVYADNPGYVMADWPTLSSVATMDGVGSAAWTAEVEVSTSQDMISWSDWTPLTSSDLTARGFMFRLLMTSDGTVTPVVTQLEVIVDMPDRFDSQKDLVCAPGVQHFDFEQAFNGLAGLTITAENLSQGLGYLITNKTLTGFDLEFVDSAGNPVGFDVTFDYIARGWGAQQ